MATAEGVDTAFGGLTVIDDASNQVKGVNISMLYEHGGGGVE